MTLRDFLDVSRLGRLFVLFGVIGFAGAVAVPAAAQSEWVTTGSPTVLESRGQIPLVALSDGTVLLFGKPVQIFHLQSGAWTDGGPLQLLKLPDTATLLPSGRILLAGGLDGASAVTNITELYDPATKVSTVTGPMHFARSGHRATLLASGKVLVSGGSDADSHLIGPAEIYDPGTGTWTVTGVLNNFRSFHGASRLANGKVLVTGGFNGSGDFRASAEVYDPASGTWAFTGTMERKLFGVLAVTLPDGRVLAVGTDPNDFASALYDPVSGTWISGATIPTAGGTSGRAAGGLVLLRDGTPLFAYGGCFMGFLSGGCFLTKAAVFDVQTASWSPSTPTPVPNSRVLGPAAAVLPDGRALFATFPSVLFRPDNTTPRLTVSPPSIDFGQTSPGDLVQHTVTLQNIGGSVLTGSVAPVSVPFSVAAASPFTLPPGESATAVVRFNPPNFGTFSGALQVMSNGNWLSIPVAGGAGVVLSGRVIDALGTGVGGVGVNLTGAATDATGTDTIGHYRLFVPPNNGYNVTPAGPGLTFTPSTRSVIVGTQDVSGLDFTATFAPAHIGVFRNGTWSLDLNGNAQWDGCGVDRCLGFGLSGDKPVAGDWSGTGKTKIGVFRNGTWSLDLNGNGQWDGCTVDACPTFGLPGDEPVVGDWAGAGHANIGVFRNGQWFLDLNGNGKWDGCGADGCLGFGLPGDLPVVGDWTGMGDVKIGVFRNGLWFLDRNGNGQWDGCAVDACIGFGLPGDLPVVGDWTGTGQDRIGVFRDGVFFLDLNGNGQWDGCVVDACVGFGLAGDHPVVGFW